jgi:hypothetical protein
MIRIKIIVAVVAMMSILAFGATCALAAAWKVGGVALVGSASIEEPVKPIGGRPILTLEVPMVPPEDTLKMTCGKLSIVGGEIVAPNKNPAQFYHFEECAATSPVGCRLASTSILTRELTGTTVTGAGTAAIMSLEPKVLTGGKRVLMEFVNRVPCLIRPCQIRSIVEGEFNFSMPTGQVENLIQPLEIVSANTLTTDGMFETIYTFEGRVELSNGEAFSFK